MDSLRIVERRIVFLFISSRTSTSFIVYLYNRPRVFRQALQTKIVALQQDDSNVPSTKDPDLIALIADVRSQRIFGFILELVDFLSFVSLLVKIMGLIDRTNLVATHAPRAYLP